MMYSAYRLNKQAAYAAAGLNASLKWILTQGQERLLAAVRANRERLVTLLSQYPFIRIVAREAQCPHIGVVSVLFDSLSPDEAGKVLDERAVAVRAGVHCSPYAHKFLGTLPGGTVRFSVSPLTPSSDFDVLKSALDDISEQL